MSLSKVKLTLPNTAVEWFYDKYQGVALSYVMTELLQLFQESAEAEDGSVEEILSRFRGI